MRIGYHSTWNHYIDVTLGEIARLYGSSIYDKRCGKSWDVGQAVCAEQYGPKWMYSPGFQEDNEVPPDLPMPSGITEAAERLIHGVEWCDKLKGREVYAVFYN
jgi:hypothetical protein